MFFTLSFYSAGKEKNEKNHSPDEGESIRWVMLCHRFIFFLLRKSITSFFVNMGLRKQTLKSFSPFLLFFPLILSPCGGVNLSIHHEYSLPFFASFCSLPRFYRFFGHVSSFRCPPPLRASLSLFINTWEPCREAEKKENNNNKREHRAKKRENLGEKGERKIIYVGESRWKRQSYLQPIGSLSLLSFCRPFFIFRSLSLFLRIDIHIDRGVRTASIFYCNAWIVDISSAYTWRSSAKKKKAQHKW